MSDIVTGISSTDLISRAARWLAFRLAGYLAVAALSAGLFFASAAIYSRIMPNEARPLPAPQIRSPEIQSDPVQRRVPSTSESIPMAQAPAHNRALKDAHLFLAGNNVAAADIYKKIVINQNYETLGEVAGFEVTPDGKITSLVVAMGGFLGMGEHIVAIPLQKAAVRKDADWQIMLNVTKDSLKAMPGFKYDNVWIPEKTAQPATNRMAPPQP